MSQVSKRNIKQSIVSLLADETRESGGQREGETYTDSGVYPKRDVDVIYLRGKQEKVEEQINDKIIKKLH